MTDSNTSAPYDGWNESDFSVPVRSDINLDDPWGPTPLGQEIAESNSCEDGNDDIFAQCTTGHALFGDVAKDEEAPASAVALDDPETAELSEEDNWPSRDEWFGLMGSDDEFGEEDYDEPEARAEFDSNRREELYVGIDLTSDLSRSIKINEFISGIQETNAEERRQITELLKDLSAKRLQIWLHWLRNQLWTGQTLLLFLEFRLNYWEANYEWWDCVFWNRGLRCWWTQPSSSALSLDDTYELVHMRQTLTPERIIDSEWVTDWNDFMPWRFGIESFANFAVLRAQLLEGSTKGRCRLARST